jgi:tetratricopeptide (TPR) repeat protein
MAYSTMGRALLKLGRIAEAEQIVQRWEDDYSQPNLQFFKVSLLAASGKLQEAREQLAQLTATRKNDKKWPIYLINAVYDSGDVETTIMVLETGIQSHTPRFIWLAATPELDPLRSDPRFRALLARFHGRP